MMPQAMDLKYYLMICECKNISRAAELLGISQPSLSIAIKRLENLAQVPLLVRSPTGVECTKAGMVFREKASELLKLWQNLSSDIQQKQDVLSGSYSIGAHSSLAVKILPHIFSKLMKQYPELELKLEHGLSRLITEQVIDFQLDFAVAVNPIMHPDLVIKEFQKDEVSFFCHESNCDSQVLIYNPHLIQAQHLLNSASKKSLNFKRFITSSSLEMIDALCLEGVGVAILPNRIRSQKLKLWRADLPAFIDRHCLIYRHDAQKSPASKTLARDLFFYLQDNPKI